MVTEREHLVIGLARPEQSLQVGELERAARDGPIARKLAEPGLHRRLVALPLLERGAELDDTGGAGGARLVRGLQPRQLDTAAFDVAGQGHRLAKHARRLVRAAGQLPRQDRLGLGDAGPDQDLAGGEEIGGRGRAGIGLDQQFEIGLDQAAQPRRAVTAVEIGLHDLAEQGARRAGAAGAGIIAGEPRFGAVERGRARIIGFEQEDRGLVLAVGLGPVAPRLGDIGQLAMDLRAQPERGGDAAAADRDQFGQRAVQRCHRLRVATLEMQDYAAQMQRLPVQNLRLVLRRQPFRTAQPARPRRFGAEPPGGGPVDDQFVHRPAAAHRRHRPVKFGEGLRRPPLVQQMHRPVVAQPPRGDRIAARHRRGAGEHRVRLGMTSEIGPLQRLVDQSLGPAARAGVALPERVEIFLRFRIGAGIVATIGLGEGALRILRAGLDPRESGGVAGAGGRDLHFAFDRAVGGEAPEPEPERAVIAA